MEEKGTTVYLDDPFCTEIKRIERAQLRFVLDKDDAINASITGPMLRASGVDWDLRHRTVSYTHLTLPTKA